MQVDISYFINKNDEQNVKTHGLVFVQQKHL